jgi:predicted nucleotidyltransferase
LAERYGVRRVWLHGSLAEGGFHEHSDIDLAAEGFAPDSAPFRAGAELDELARPLAVDLVPLEDARPSVRARILQHGELLYDRDQT